jgi:hypothetical protein
MGRRRLAGATVLDLFSMSGGVAKEISKYSVTCRMFLYNDPHVKMSLPNELVLTAILRQIHVENIVAVCIFPPADTLRIQNCVSRILKACVECNTPFLLVQPASFCDRGISEIFDNIPVHRIERFVFDSCAFRAPAEKFLCVCFELSDVGRLKSAVCDGTRARCEFTDKPHVLRYGRNCMRGDKHTISFNRACATALLSQFLSQESLKP